MVGGLGAVAARSSEGSLLLLRGASLDIVDLGVARGQLESVGKGEDKSDDGKSD